MVERQESLFREGRGMPGHYGGIKQREGVVRVVLLVAGADAQQGQSSYGGEKLPVRSVALGLLVELGGVCASVSLRPWHHNNLHIR